MKKIPVIIDCDPGCDDAIAIFLALSSEKLDVKAVTVSAGNVTLEKTGRNALDLIALAGADIPVAKGCSHPLMRTIVTAPEVHGESGIGGVFLKKSQKTFSDYSAVELMAKILRESEEKVTIIVTGPMTNIAALLLAHGELKDKIEKFSIMGGSAGRGNVTPAAEFNIYVDPEAASVVFASGVPIIMCGLDVTLKALIFSEDTDAMRAIGNKVSIAAGDIIDHQVEFHKNMGRVGVPMHDPCAVAYVIDPTLFSGKKCFVGIETKGEFTSGATVVDLADKYGRKANAEVILDLDREKFVNMLLEGLKKYNK